MSENTTYRLNQRALKLRRRDYLVYRALWPRLKLEINHALQVQDTAFPTVLDVGCGERPYEDLFCNCYYIGLNYGADGASPDVIGDAQCLPIASSSVDIVFSTQVIEHLPRPQDFISEARRVLRSGGTLILSGPFFWPLHEEPHDYFRFTKYGLEYLCSQSGFKVLSIEGDSSFAIQVIVSIIELLPAQLSFFIPIFNLIGRLLEAHSSNKKSTLNYVLHAIKL